MEEAKKPRRLFHVAVRAIIKREILIEADSEWEAEDKAKLTEKVGYCVIVANRAPLLLHESQVTETYVCS